MSLIPEPTDKEGIFINKKTGWLLKEKDGQYYLFAKKYNNDVIPLDKNDIMMAKVFNIFIDNEALINTGPTKG